MAPKKNIAIIVPTLNKGGAERVAANLSIEFAKYFNVYLIVHDASEIIYDYSGKLIDLKLPPSRGKCGKLITMLKRISAVRKLKKKLNIDYSISHLVQSNYVNVFSRRRDKVYTYVHNMYTPGRINIIRERLTAALSDKVICVSECVRQNMINNYSIPEQKTVTVYNFCDGKTYYQREQHDENVTIVNMGRLTEQKGQWHLIKAMSQVVKSHKNVVLNILGEGELRPELEKLTTDLNLSEYVNFKGYVKEAFKELQNSDIYVSSSHWEGLPMSLIEAGLNRLPIISTDCDAGCREILAPDTEVTKKTSYIEYAEYGVLVPVCNGTDFSAPELTGEEIIMAQAIDYLVENENERGRYGVQSAERAKRFSPERIMKDWMELLK